MKSKYMDLTTKLVQREDLYKAEIEKLERRVQLLGDKLEEKNHEARELHQPDSSDNRPALSYSFSYAELPEGVDPRIKIAQLKKALDSKDDKVNELLVQVASFDEIASQHKQLQSHSRAKERAGGNKGLCDY